MRDAWQAALVGTTCQSSWGTSGCMPSTLRPNGLQVNAKAATLSGATILRHQPLF
jgi:hypothetical protein